MKKALLTLLILVTSINIVYANNPQYESELSKIRTIKNAKTAILNKEIKEISSNIVELELNTTINELEKEKKLQLYNKKLEELATKKTEISEQYKRDKAVLKKKYK